MSVTTQTHWTTAASSLINFSRTQESSHKREESLLKSFHGRWDLGQRKSKKKVGGVRGGGIERNSEIKFKIPSVTYFGGVKEGGSSPKILIEGALCD